MMITRLVLLACLLLLPFTAHAQLAVDWSRQYDNHENDDYFNDIYAVAGGGYVTCGMSGGDVWLTRLNAAGEVMWSNAYDGGGAEFQAVWTIIESDAGNFLVGMQRDGNFSALLVDDEGEEIWWRDYNEGICHALIELKSDNFMLVGHGGPLDRKFGRLIMIDPDGDVLWDRDYRLNGQICDLYHLKETEGGIVVTGYVASLEAIQTALVHLVKFDFNGEVVWSHTYQAGGHYIGRSIVAGPDETFSIAGYDVWEGWNRGTMFLLNVDANGNMNWYREYDRETFSSSEVAWSLTAPEEGGYAIVGGTLNRQTGFGQLKMIRTTDRGVVRWKRLFGFDGARNSAEIMFYSVVTCHDNTFLAAGNIDNSQQPPGFNGFIAKFVPERFEPMNIYYEPRDTSLTILRFDRVHFLVRVEGEPVGDVSYLWTLDGEEMSIDSTFRATFREFGEYEVCCYVSDEERDAVVRWRVLVDDLYIVRSSPEENPLQLRRGTGLAFSIDSVATIYDRRSLDYYWTLTYLDLGESREITDSVAVWAEFDQTGSYSVEGLVVHEQQFDAVQWDIEVLGIIKTFQPHTNQLTLQPDSSVTLRIVPVQESNLNEVQWYMDGERRFIGRDPEFIFTAEEIGRHNVMGILTDTLESDSVEWDITVEIPDDVKEGGLKSANPDGFGLISVSPNPFNSTLTISFAAVNSGKQKLAIIDLSGKEVALLIDSKSGIRNHKSEITWNASSVPAGVYLIHLESGSYRAVRKAVLIK